MPIPPTSPFLLCHMVVMTKIEEKYDIIKIDAEKTMK